MCVDREAKNADNWRLYHLLELEPPVTAKQVQWLFRKVTLRHHFYQAYVVLQDEERKSLYDTLGEDVVGFIHSGGWGPLIQWLGARRTIIAYCSTMALSFFFALIFFLLAGLKADKQIGSAWAAVASPLIIVLVMMCLVTGAALLASLLLKAPKEEGMRWVDRIPPIGNSLASFFYLLFCALVVAHIDSSPGKRLYDYSPYFALPIAADAVYYLSSLAWRWPRCRRLDLEVGLSRPSFLLCYGPFVMALLHVIMSLVKWAVLALRVDRKVNISWYETFVPFAVSFILFIGETCIISLSRRAVGVRTIFGVAFDVLGSVFFHGMLLVSLYFASVSMTRGRQRVRMTHALIPVYLVLVYLIGAMIYTLVYLLRADVDNKREERLNNLKWTPTEPEIGDGNVPKLLRDINNADPIVWDDIDDDTSVAMCSDTPGEDLQGTHDYDEFESDEELEEGEEGEEDQGDYDVYAGPEQNVPPAQLSHVSQSNLWEAPSQNASQYRIPSPQSQMRGSQSHIPSSQLQMHGSHSYMPTATSRDISRSQMPGHSRSCGRGHRTL
ncbi:hypothetical protein ERJ75_000043100 [Trypanosoma vivax]|nr:hypothetical protein ERJ75_000043100 [Trypanosoma vivax]